MKRHFSLLALFVLLFGAALLGAPPAHATRDCNDPSYLGQFDPRFAASHDFLCVETDRTTVHSDAGSTYIRIIQHLNADWATRPGAMAAIKNGVDAAARAMPRLGHFRINDVTILLVDGYGMHDNGEVFEELGGYTDFSPGSECHITLYLLGPAATAADAANATAHELFHCVQLASLTQAQLQTSNFGSPGGGTWWIEGAAEWFTTLALPAPSYQPTRVTAFDGDSPTTAVNDMAYGAYVFFAWLGGSAHGPNSVVPFLQQMASSSSTGAQQTAMAAALPGADWLTFAEDYMDQDIRDGQGVSIGSAPQEGQTLTWDDTRTERIAYAPFTLVRRNLSFQCGRWSIAPRPSQYHAAKPSESGDWADLPGDLDNLGNDHGDFRFVGMNATSSNAPLQLAVTRTARCEECGGARAIDQCMIGQWELTVDGALAFAREHFPGRAVSVPTRVGNVLALNRDGTFATGQMHIEADEVDRGVHGHVVMDSQGSGRWSAARGQVTYCVDQASLTGQVTASGGGYSGTAPIQASIPPMATHAYTCSGNTFTQTTQVGRVGTVTSTYNRIAH